MNLRAIGCNVASAAVGVRPSGQPIRVGWFVTACDVSGAGRRGSGPKPGSRSGPCWARAPPGRATAARARAAVATTAPTNAAFGSNFFVTRMCVPFTIGRDT